MARKMHPSGRPQQQKSMERVGEAFTVFRPLTDRSKSEIYGIINDLQSDGVIPSHAEIKQEDNLRVTYVERNRMTKQLQGFAADGFDASRVAYEALNRNSALEELVVDLGKIAIMGRRDMTFAVRTYHSQELAEEYQAIINGFSKINVPRDRRGFQPHISLFELPFLVNNKELNLSFEEKMDLSKAVEECLPETVALAGLQSFPKNPRNRR